MPTAASSVDTESGRTRTFPAQLHHVLDKMERDGLSHIASWRPHGRCFQIHNKDEFLKNVLVARSFRQTKFPSFQRQLNAYNFQRISSGSDKGSYYHASFIRGESALAQTIPRVGIKGQGPRRPGVASEDPNFYDVPPDRPLASARSVSNQSASAAVAAVPRVGGLCVEHTPDPTTVLALGGNPMNDPNPNGTIQPQGGVAQRQVLNNIPGRSLGWSDRTAFHGFPLAVPFVSTENARVSAATGVGARSHLGAEANLHHAIAARLASLDAIQRNNLGSSGNTAFTASLPPSVSQFVPTPLLTRRAPPLGSLGQSAMTSHGLTSLDSLGNGPSHSALYVTPGIHHTTAPNVAAMVQALQERAGASSFVALQGLQGSESHGFFVPQPVWIPSAVTALQGIGSGPSHSALYDTPGYHHTTMPSLAAIQALQERGGASSVLALQGLQGSDTHMPFLPPPVWNPSAVTTLQGNDILLELLASRLNSS